MRLWLKTLAAFLFGLSVASAQAPVKQSGNITAGHQTIWAGQGLVSDGGGQAINTPMSGGSTSSLAASSTTYCATSGCNASSNIAALSTVAGSVSNLYFSVANAPTGGQTIVVTLNVGTYGLLVPTTVTCTISGTATSCSDTTHLASISPGQSWAISAVLSSGAVSTGGQSFGVQLTSVYPAPLPSQTVRQSGNITAGHAVIWTTNGVVQDAGFGLLGPLALTFPPNTVFANPTNATAAPQATNVPTAATPAVGDNSLRLATTAFVNGSFPKILTGFAGVDPSGATDSSAGVTTALNSGGVILAPCGTYLLASTVTVTTPVKLIGCGMNGLPNGGAAFQGTTFRTPNDGLHITTDMFHFNADNISFDTINCQRPGSPVASSGSCISVGTDEVNLTDGVILHATQTNLQSSSASFTSADVGKQISITGSITNAPLFTSITAVVDSHNVTLANAGTCASTCSSLSFTYAFVRGDTSITNVSSNNNGALVHFLNASNWNVSGVSSQDFRTLIIQNDTNFDQGGGTFTNSIISAKGITGSGTDCSTNTCNVWWVSNGGVRISNVYFLSAAYGMYSTAGATGNLTMTGNIFEGYTTAALWFKSSSESSGTSFGFTGAVITGNRFGTGGLAAVAVDFDPTASFTMADVTITGNIFDHSGSSDPPGNLLELGQIAGFSVRDNYFKGNGGQNGINLETSATKGTVAPNFYNNLTANVNGTGGSGVLLALQTTDGGTGQTSFTSNLPLVGNGTGSVSQGTRSGNTTKFGTTTGALTSGNCVKIDAFGNFVDNGGTCGTGGVVLSPPPQGRLTLTSGTPVMIANVTGATETYYAPATGNVLPIYNGSSMVPTVFAQLENQSTCASTTCSGGTCVAAACGGGPAAMVADTNYDLFVWNNSGNLVLTRGPAWTGRTTRGTGAGTTQLSMVQGVWVNTVSITNGPGANLGTYVGTVWTDAAAGTVTMQFTSALVAGGQLQTFGVWNAYNQVLATSLMGDGTASWTQTTATIQPYDVGATGSGLNNRVKFVQGLSDNAMTVSWNAFFNSPATASATFALGWCLDCTNNFTQRFFYNTPTSTVYNFQPSMTYVLPPQLGNHFLQRTSQSDGTHTVTYLGGALFSDTFSLSIWN